MQRVSLFKYVKRENLWEQCLTDRTIQKLLRELKEACALEFSRPGDIQTAKAELLAALARMALMQNRSRYRKTMIKTIEAKINQRLSTMSELKLRALTRKLYYE